MKKFLALLTLTGLLTLQANAQWIFPGGPYTVTGTVLYNTMTNLVTGSFKVSQVILTSTNNATLSLVDASTNNITYVVQPYTNIVYALTNANSLATNGGYNDFTYTNYFGVVTSLTNASGYSQQYVIVELTNSTALTTNNLPSISLSVQANVPLIINNLDLAFLRGIWVTNTSSTLQTAINVTVVGTRYQ